MCQLYQGNAHINTASLPFSFIIVPNLIYNDQHVMYFDRVNLLSVGESQKIPCYELAQIVFS